MRILISVLATTLIVSLVGQPPRAGEATPGEWQLTHTPINHSLDNNDNFSPDDRFLVYDTRETLGGGIGNCTSIMKVSIATGLESPVYAPQDVIVSTTAPAPGMGAASFSPVDNEVVFIHGPFVHETPRLGFYGTTNRRGGVVMADGSGVIRFFDYRDVTNSPTTPGAHRGGTHRHEYTLDGKRVGFTYDDALMTNYGRTIGMMVPHPRAPGGVSHWTVLLVPIVPTNEAQVGELDRAADDSWVGAQGLMRAFIGRVKQPDGTFMSSLFVVDVPADVDVTTADAGSKTVYPKPPAGTAVRRLTHTAASGIVRGSHDGTRIGYYATADDGTRQAFVISSTGSDRSPDPAQRPIQASFLSGTAGAGLRWHPSGNSIALTSENAVVVICVKPGPLFGASYFLTPRGGQYAIEALVWSRKGSLLAYNKRVPTYDAAGRPVRDFNNNNFRQIFMVAFPDANNNGIADPVEQGVARNSASNVPDRLAPGSMASFFGTELARGTESASGATLPTSLGGVSVEVTSGRGAAQPAGIQMVSPGEVRFVVPAGDLGPGVVTVTTADGRKLSTVVQHEAVVPGLYAAGGTGSGPAAAAVVRIDEQGGQTTQVVSQCPSGPTSCRTVPIDLGPASDQAILLLYGTGLRGWRQTIAATVGGQAADVIGAAPHGEFPGVDQINVRLARSLAGKGEVPVQVAVDGKRSNLVTVNIR